MTSCGRHVSLQLVGSVHHRPTFVTTVDEPSWSVGGYIDRVQTQDVRKFEIDIGAHRLKSMKSVIMLGGMVPMHTHGEKPDKRSTGLARKTSCTAGPPTTIHSGGAAHMMLPSLVQPSQFRWSLRFGAEAIGGGRGRGVQSTGPVVTCRIF